MSTFPQRLAILCGTALALAVGTYGLVAVAKYKPYGVPDILRDEWDAKQAQIKAAEQARLASMQQAQSASTAPPDATSQAVVPTPLAVVDQSEHDFGMLDPGISAKHTFVIANHGDSPLVLSAGETSCKCTLSEASTEVVAPGAQAEISLTWNTGTARQFYRQYALVKTNDPKHREIELAVSGTVRALLAFDSDEVVAPIADPGSGARSSVLLYSQYLQEFEVSNVECDLPGFVFEVLPVSTSELDAVEAKSAWRLMVSTDGSLPKGEFSQIIRVHVTSKQQIEGEDEAIREIPFRGRVLSPITFYGAGLHSDDGLDLGTVAQGQEKIVKIMVRTRGNRLPEKLEITRISPSFLQASVEAHPTRSGIHTLSIVVPKDAPQTVFNREQDHGFVEVGDPENPNNKNSFPLFGAVLAL
jgi:hypothetical protein